MSLKWKDKNNVCMISTVHNNKSVWVKRYSSRKFIPEVVDSYNNTMGGVYLLDQKMSSYKTTRKRMKKAYKSMFFYLLDISFWNYYHIYRLKEGDNSMKSLSFKLTIIDDIVKKGSLFLKSPMNYIQSPSKSPSKEPVNNFLPNTLSSGSHFPFQLSSEGKTRQPRLPCKVCSRVYKKRKDVSTICKTCNVPLCIGSCYELWHLDPNLHSN